METETVSITILCNPPRLYRGEVNFNIGVDDEIVAKGKAGETVTVQIGKGLRNISLWIENGTSNTFGGTTPVQPYEGMSLKIRYGIMSNTVKLVKN